MVKSIILSIIETIRSIKSLRINSKSNHTLIDIKEKKKIEEKKRKNQDD